MAATVKQQAKGLLRAARDLLANKTLPKALRTQLEALGLALRKTWAELEADATHDPVEESLDESMDIRSSVMVALFLPAEIAGQVAQEGEGALPTGELHLTLAFLGDDATQFLDQAVLEGVVRSVAQQFYGISGKINGRGVFSVEDGLFAHVLLVDSPSLTEMRYALVQALREAGITPVNNHGFTPHVTLAYSRDEWRPSMSLLAINEVVFRELVIAWGDQRTYIPFQVDQAMSEAVTLLESGIAPLVEGAVRADGTIPVKIITPGWGSSGYYPASVLERDGPRVFVKGVKMYWNHPTPTEEAERPERDLRDLAAELISDARWVADHPAGPGLYADAKVFGEYKASVDELAPHIGVSIRAMGRASTGEADGRAGAIIEEITAARSVDFVTEPGAGGQILTLFEAARGSVRVATTSPEEVSMTKEEIEALQAKVAQLEAENADLKKKVKAESDAKEAAEAARSAAVTEAARLREAKTMSDAASVLFTELGSLDMPEPTRKRLVETLKRNLPLTEAGVLDEAALKERAQKAAKEEMAYLAEASGVGSIRGMGASGGNTIDPEVVEAGLVTAFQGIGLSEAAAKSAAHGR